MSAPDLVLALAKVFAGHEAARVVAELLREHKELDQAARGTVARRIFAPALLRARLDFRASLEEREWYSPSEEYSLIGFAERDLPVSAQSLRRAVLRLAVYLLEFEEAGPATVCALSGLSAPIVGELARRLVEPTRWPASPVARLAAERSLPDWLATLWVDELGPRAAQALAIATNSPGPLTVRVNLARAPDRAALARALADEGIVSSPTRYSPWGLRLWGRVNVFGSAAWRAGAFEVQDEGSQLVALATGARPGERVVDLCAGAGGKTLALAMMMGHGAGLCASDVDARRLSDLRARLRRAGVSAAEVLLPPPASGSGGSSFSSVMERWHGADLVLVDAPCSSLGTLRRGPDVRWRLNPASLKAFPALQRELLGEGASLLRPGGRLVYATCTLRHDENEGVADSFTDSVAGAGISPCSVASLLGEPLARAVGAAQTLTLRPDLHGTDGFFIAAWRRQG